MVMEKMVSANWQDKVRYGDENPEPVILAGDEKMRVILGGLKSGQRIPPHPEAEAVYHFLQGEGVMFVGDETIPVSAGSTVVVPQGAKRGMQAETRLAFLAVRVS